MQLTHKQHQFFNQAEEPQTPYLLVDLDVVEQSYCRLAEAFPFADIYYAVKCNPAAPVIDRLRGLGARFETASLPEIQACLCQGVPPEHIHFGNTIKSASAIRAAHAMGVESFGLDSPMELHKLATHAPHSKVSYRLETDGQGAGFGLDRKFGASVDQIADMMVEARSLALTSHGVSFHVGSQQMDPEAWVRAIEDIAHLMDKLERHDIRFYLVNLGGGFPAASTPLLVKGARLAPDRIDVFGGILKDAVRRLLPADMRFMIEPGRCLTADAGVIRSSVLLVSRRAPFQRPSPQPGQDRAGRRSASKRWVYLDVGRFNGLHDAGTVAFPIQTSRDASGERLATVLAGPTCDSDDILYDEQAGLLLPDPLDEGDKVMFGGTGAYSGCFSTVGFNGFPALAEHYI